MRYIQEKAEAKPPTKPEKDKEPRTLAGSKDYDYYDLSRGKKIPTKGGYK